MQRLAVIGLDAAEPEFLERLIAEGRLPTLARLRQASARCNLHSEATWRAGRVWETLLSGTADFPSANVFDTREYRSWQLGARKKTPFYADMPGLNVLAIDVPYMSLWYDVPGAQVVWGGHDAGYPRASRPAGLVREIDAKFGVHPAFHNDFTCAWWDERSINTLADALIVGSQRRCEIIGWLCERFPDWNLLLTVLSEAHSAGEIFWHGVSDSHPLSRVPTAPLARRRLDRDLRRNGPGSSAHRHRFATRHARPPDDRSRHGDQRLRRAVDGPAALSCCIGPAPAKRFCTAIAPQPGNGPVARPWFPPETKSGATTSARDSAKARWAAPGKESRGNSAWDASAHRSTS